MPRTLGTNSRQASRSDASTPIYPSRVNPGCWCMMSLLWMFVGLKEDGEVLCVQNHEIGNNLAAGQLPAAVRLAERVLALAHEEVGVIGQTFQSAPIDEEIRNN